MGRSGAIASRCRLSIGLGVCGLRIMSAVRPTRSCRGVRSEGEAQHVPVVWLPKVRFSAGGSFDGCSVLVMRRREASSWAGGEGVFWCSNERWGETRPGAMAADQLV